MRRLTLLCALVAAAPAEAACSVAASPVAFGTVDVMGLSRGAGEVVVRCDATTAFEVGLSPGAGAGGGGRRMAGPGGSGLDYSLFSDAGYTVEWGDGRAIGPSRPGRSDGDGPTRLTVYGLVPRQPGTPPGSYADSLQVTLTF